MFASSLKNVNGFVIVDKLQLETSGEDGIEIGTDRLETPRQETRILDSGYISLGGARSGDGSPHQRFLNLGVHVSYLRAC